MRGAGVVVAAMLAPVGVGVGVLSNQVNDAVGTIVAGTDDDQLTRAQVPLTTTVLDRTGAPIATLYDQYRLPVTYDGIAKTMDAAIIAIEDRRFFTEAGVDPRAVLRAAVNNTSGGSTQGASTITQQYVKNYLINVIDRTDPAAQRADRADTISRKVREAELALQLGHSVPKEQILAGYLNVVEFSGSVYGVGRGRARLLRHDPRQAHRAAGRAAGRDGEQPEPLQPLHPPPAGGRPARHRARRDGRHRLDHRRRRGHGQGGAARGGRRWSRRARQHLLRGRAGRGLLLRLRGALPGAGRASPPTSSRRAATRSRRRWTPSSARP